MKEHAIKISIGQVLARELYELARAPRIVATTLSQESKTELLTMLKPAVDKDAPTEDTHGA